MIPVVDIAFIVAELRRLSDELLEAHEDQRGGSDTDPRILVGALYELLDELRNLEDDPGPDSSLASKHLEGLANHGLELLTRLSAVAGRLRRPHEARAVEILALPLSCWIARRGGEVSNIALAVNGAAALANSVKSPAQLAQLFALLTELTNAVSPQISQDPSHYDSTRPWRTLLINRAIVATRSHQPALMEEAFDALIEHLPGEVPDFLREGMEQMDALNYPPHVKRVMERYYDLWCGHRILH